AIMGLLHYMLSPSRPEAPISETHSGFGRAVRRAATWPFRLAGAAFWLTNDLLERLASALAAMLRRIVGSFLQDRAQQVGRLARFSRRLVDAAAIAVLILLLFFELGPFYWVITTAFKTDLQITRWISVLWPRPWVLDQFRTLLGPRHNFLVWLRNTVVIATISPIIATGCASLSAYALVRLRWRGSAVIANGVLISYLMPAVLLVIPIYELFTRLGLTNTMLSLILSYPTFTLPFAVWLMMGYYSSIPRELEAAAMVDGCGRLQTFTRIVLPLTKPALLATALFGVTQAWNEYLFAATFIASENKMTIALGLAQMIFGDVTPWGLLSAAAVIMSVPVLFLYTIGQRFMVAGLTAGAVKGRG
ncbi:MAG: carbohydrate ABC transporter permease, partial [Chloroflexi bacterium]|nr:carbohydrate ABC transporter permease [Chloroflexota bacterium]